MRLEHLLSGVLRRFGYPARAVEPQSSVHHFDSGALSGSVAVFPSLWGRESGRRFEVQSWDRLSSLLLRCYGCAIQARRASVRRQAAREGRMPSRKQTFIDILIQAEKLRVEQKSKSLMYIDAPPPDASAVSSRKGSDSGVKAWREEKRQEVYKGHMVDAWALGGDEGRDKLR